MKMKYNIPLSHQELTSRAEAFINAIIDETERGCVLTASAFLNETMELLLRKHFSSSQSKPAKVINSLFGSSGPLSSLWSKTQMCFALSLIDEWLYKDLEIVRLLRNAFAHTYEPVDFSSNEVITLTEKFVSSDMAVSGSDVETQKKALRVVGHKRKKEHVRFICAACYMAGALCLRLDENYFKKDNSSIPRKW